MRGRLPSVSEYDCQRCGACCVNTPDNRAESFVDYIELEKGATLLTRRDLGRRYTVERDGRIHMRLHPDGRCSALLGALGRRVRCAIYSRRPAACRRVEAGSELCLAYRRAQGLFAPTVPTNARATLGARAPSASTRTKHRTND